MPTRLRQIALVSPTLEATLTTFTSTFNAPVVERDPGVGAFGLHNGLIQLGDCFLEVVAPLPNLDPLTTAAGRYISKFGAGGYMVLMQVDNLNQTEANLSHLPTIHAGGRDYCATTNSSHIRPHLPGTAILPVHANNGSGVDGISTTGTHGSGVDGISITGTHGSGVDGISITGTHYHPRDMGCIIEATENTPRHQWLWAGHEWYQHSPKGSSTQCGGFARVVIACKDPAQTCHTWHTGLALIKKEAGSTALWTEDGCEIAFRKPLHALENGPVEIDLWSRSKALIGVRTTLCGVVFGFVALSAKL